MYGMEWSLKEMTGHYTSTYVVDSKRRLKEKDNIEESSIISFGGKNIPFVITAIINMIVFPFSKLQFPHGHNHN